MIPMSPVISLAICLLLLGLPAGAQVQMTDTSASTVDSTVSAQTGSLSNAGTALAEKQGGAGSNSSTQSQAPLASATAGIKGKMSWLFSQLPKNVPAFVSGCVVGTPIAVVRMSKREIARATTDLVGETDNPLLLGLGGVLGVPAGLLSGGVYGLYAGIADSWVNADDDPYSRASFSLEEMK